MVKYLFAIIMGFMALFLVLRILDSISLWGWALFFCTLGAVYWGYVRWRDRRRGGRG